MLLLVSTNFTCGCFISFSIRLFSEYLYWWTCVIAKCGQMYPQSKRSVYRLERTPMHARSPLENNSRKIPTNPSVKLVGRRPGNHWLKSLWVTKKEFGDTEIYFLPEQSDKGGLNSVFSSALKMDQTGEPTTNFTKGPHPNSPGYHMIKEISGCHRGHWLCPAVPSCGDLPRHSDHCHDKCNFRLFA